MKPIVIETTIISGQVLQSASVKMYKAAQEADLIGCTPASEMLAKVAFRLDEAAHLPIDAFASRAVEIYESLNFDKNSKVSARNQALLEDFLANSLRLAANLGGQIVKLTVEAPKGKGKKGK